MQNYKSHNTGEITLKQPPKTNRSAAQNSPQASRGVRVNSAPPNVRYERINPMKPSPRDQHSASRQASQQSKGRQAKTAVDRKLKTKLAIRDYLFGLVVGFIIFGVAAIFVCNALIGMIS